MRRSYSAKKKILLFWIGMLLFDILYIFVQLRGGTISSITDVISNVSWMLPVVYFIFAVIYSMYIKYTK